ncbi:LacI family DNA-binding transcriptional regulator [Sanguibacter sp. 25GB23B1]|uniref:LacI family DNA-binding transcriptional regulator n=1 Tax=unclassified Sanguibacter TaxID=2645534 RepID=UPI0032AEBA0C
MPASGRRPTLVTVAHAAGVSRATASRVLAGSTSVDPTMTAAVWRAARELRYETNRAAQSLRSGRTGSIALVAAASELDQGIAGAFTAAPIRGATQVLIEAQVQPVLLLADAVDPGRVPEYLRRGHVDGAIVLLQHEITFLHDELADLDLPLVYVGRPAGPRPQHPVVDCDNAEGARLATRALLEAGRRRLVMIAGPTDLGSGEDRVTGFRDELESWGMPHGRIARGEFTLATGAAAMARLLAQDPTIDGVFASSDLMAVGAVRVLTSAGRTVPDDVSVVGFDDTVVAATCDPPLTSVRQPLEEMGRTAARLLLDAPPTGWTDVPVLPTSLTTRESV